MPDRADPSSAATPDLGALSLALITSRHSVSPKRLEAPGPSEDQLRAMVEAAGCAPDHELLRPWRFIRIGDAQRDALADLFVRALLERVPDAPADAQAQAREKAYRAPVLLLAVVRLLPPHEAVPEAERHVALGAALQNLLLAAHGLGFGAMLTSGHAVHARCFAEAFGLAEGEAASCFVSIGTPSQVKRRSRPGADELLSDWRHPA